VECRGGVFGSCPKSVEFRGSGRGPFGSSSSRSSPKLGCFISLEPSKVRWKFPPYKATDEEIG